MQDRAASLHAAIVPATDDLVVHDKHRANRDATFSQSQLSLFDGRLQKWVGRHGNGFRTGSQRSIFLQPKRER